MRLAMWLAATSLMSWASTPLSAGETVSYTYDALGRLVVVQHAGTVNDGVTTDIVYDAAGNRTSYEVTGSGNNNGTPANQPPTAVDDTKSVQVCNTASKNVILNDSDPEQNYPLVVVSEDSPHATIAYGASIVFTAPSAAGTYIVNYTVEDSLGASSTAKLTMTAVDYGTSCP